ncbi:conserved hypothetical protein, membrane or secreted [Candidatus Magnetomorum sp. HK-1]|nr:conserved hypothetical protein, membrane or secreted [Candidatus Magnetomorum sp. HK-1]
MPKKINNIAVNSGLVSMMVLLILSLLSLLSLSLFRTGINSLFVMRNEMASVKSFYRAQDAAGEMVELVCNMDDNLLLKAITNPSNECSWLKIEKDIDFNQMGNTIYWQQLSPKNLPPDSQAIAVYLNALQLKMPSESLVMTHGEIIKSYRFSIIAKSEVAGGLAVVEMGLSRKIAQ